MSDIIVGMTRYAFLLAASAAADAPKAAVHTFVLAPVTAFTAAAKAAAVTAVTTAFAVTAAAVDGARS